MSGTNVVAAVAVLLGGGAGFYFYNQDGKKDLLDVGVGKATSKLGGSKDKIANQTGIGSADDYQRVSLLLDLQLCHLDLSLFHLSGLQRHCRQAGARPRVRRWPLWTCSR